MMLKNKTWNMMLAKFRHKYPQGSLVSELIEIDRGTYIVKAAVEIDNIVLATALAGAASVEAAEDAAKERAIATLFLDRQPQPNSPALSTAPRSQPAVPAPLPTQPLVSELVRLPSPEESNVNFSEPPSQPVVSTSESAPVSLARSSSESNSEPTPNLFGDTFATADSTIKQNPEGSSNSGGGETTTSAELEAMDFNNIKQKTDIEIKRLGWTGEQGREFLMSRYGKRSRLHLKDEQLIEFLHYLENLPNPVT